MYDRFRVEVDGFWFGTDSIDAIKWLMSHGEKTIKIFEWDDRIADYKNVDQSRFANLTASATPLF